MPTVLNRHHFHKSEIPHPWMYVGRGTPLGNPYSVDEHGLAALGLYREWLWKKIATNDAEVLKALFQIQPDHGLVCSCAPRPCHAEIIVSAWTWCHEHGVWYEEAEREAMMDPTCH